MSRDTDRPRPRQGGLQKAAPVLTESVSAAKRYLMEERGHGERAAQQLAEYLNEHKEEKSTRSETIAPGERRPKETNTSTMTTTITKNDAQRTPAKTANELIENEELSRTMATEIVKYIRHPVQSRRRQYLTEMEQKHSKPRDSGLEWVGRFIEHRRTEESPFNPSGGDHEPAQTDKASPFDPTGPETDTAASSKGATAGDDDAASDSPFDPYQ